MKDLYFNDDKDKLNGILKGCIEVLKRPLVDVSRVNSMRYKISSQNGCFVIFVDGVESGISGNVALGAKFLEIGNTRVRTAYADNKLVKELSNMVLKKYGECTYKEASKTKFLNSFSTNYFQK